MRFKKILLITALTILFFIIASCVTFCLTSPEICRCCFVSYSDNFSKAESNLYISNDTPGNIKDSVIALFRIADKRVAEFWNQNKRGGNPVIIYCDSELLYSAYSKRGTILTYNTPINSFIVFGRNSLDEDMLSHELFHTELYARLSYFNSINRIPRWFDEGLAMQVDFREEYSEKKYLELSGTSGFLTKLSEISTPQKFYGNNFYFHYILVKHEVNLWMNNAGKKGLYSMIERINNGEDFYRFYRQLKSKKE